MSPFLKCLHSYVNSLILLCFGGNSVEMKYSLIKPIYFFCPHDLPLGHLVLECFPKYKVGRQRRYRALQLQD